MATGIGAALLSVGVLLVWPLPLVGVLLMLAGAARLAISLENEFLGKPEPQR